VLRCALDPRSAALAASLLLVASLSGRSKNFSQQRREDIMLPLYLLQHRRFDLAIGVVIFRICKALNVHWFDDYIARKHNDLSRFIRSLPE
jgi:hypothetical protein